MKRAIFIIISLILALACLTVFPGCGSNEESAIEHTTDEPVSLSIVMGVHKNFPKLSFTAESIQKSIYDACYSYGDVSAFTVEGTPKPHGNYDIEKPDKSITDTKRKQLARQNTNKIINDCSLAAATTEEVDTLAAIKLSADDLQESSASNRQLIVYDSGLCTEGLLSQISNDVLSTDPELIVKKLAEVHSLPNLKGINVKWLGLGCVSGKQSEIPNSYKYKLEKLWTTIITASGGTVEFDKTPIYGEEAEGLPNVSTVSFVQDSLNIDYSDATAVNAPIKFDESTIKFVGDSDAFIDDVGAKEALSPIADILVANPTFKIIIAGTTASVGDGYALSFKRANACKKILVSMGANDAQIECIGLGSSENCFHVDDLDSNGNLIEEYAKLNRAIYIFAADSDVARIVNGT